MLRRNLPLSRTASPSNERLLENWSSPMREFSRLQNEMDRFFGNFMSSIFNAAESSLPGSSWLRSWNAPFMGAAMPSLPSTSVGTSMGEMPISFAPTMDVTETPSHYIVSWDIPGVSKDDIRMEVRDSQLIVSGQRKEEKHERATGREYHERAHGSFYRSFMLPADAEADRIEATYRDGVLSVVLPRIEMAKGRVIKIGDAPSKLLKQLEGSEKKAG